MNEDRSRQRLGRGLASLIGAGAGVPARPVPGFEGAEGGGAAPVIPPERTIPIDRISAEPEQSRAGRSTRTNCGT